MKLQFLFFVGFISFFGYSNDDQRKLISDDNYNYVFFISLDKISNYKVDKLYYWYKSGKVHSSVGVSNGELLNGNYIKSNIDNNILETGDFKLGLKDNIWKEWYDNGNIKEITNWSVGHKSGEFIEYSHGGEIILEGKYKNDKKHGLWIKPLTKDTLYYNKGVLVDKNILKEEKEKRKENSFFKKLFSKKEKDASSKKTNQSKKKKESFFTKLFSKKDELKEGDNSRVPKRNNKVKKQSFFTKLFSKKDKSIGDNSIQKKVKGAKKESFFTRLFSKKEKKTK